MIYCESREILQWKCLKPENQANCWFTNYNNNGGKLTPVSIQIIDGSSNYASRATIAFDE